VKDSAQKHSASWYGVDVVFRRVVVLENIYSIKTEIENSC